MNDHPPACPCGKCLTGLGKWNLHSPEARRRSRRRKLLVNVKKEEK